jgi:hypothetical protein
MGLLKLMMNSIFINKGKTNNKIFINNPVRDLISVEIKNYKLEKSR